MSRDKQHALGLQAAAQVYQQMPRNEELPAASGTQQQAQAHSGVLDALRRDLEAARYRAQRAESLIREIVVDIDEQASQVVLLIHWKGGSAYATASARRRRGESSGHIPKDIVEAVRVLSRIYSDEMSLGFPGFADLPIQRLPDLTPAAWVASIRSLDHQPLSLRSSPTAAQPPTMEPPTVGALETVCSAFMLQAGVANTRISRTRLPVSAFCPSTLAG